jgi:hypothetical protein
VYTEHIFEYPYATVAITASTAITAQLYNSITQLHNAQDIGDMRLVIISHQHIIAFTYAVGAASYISMLTIIIMKLMEINYIIEPGPAQLSSVTKFSSAQHLSSN